MHTNINKNVGKFTTLFSLSRQITSITSLNHWMSWQQRKIHQFFFIDLSWQIPSTMRLNHWMSWQRTYSLFWHQKEISMDL